ncbi:hypothetical protein B0A48_10043 [Cryoendolithus antarcticus]|uniref:Uncharacterized protein n=1 Tax=Cryoendolithus antarcticus TaxID=1507870 RepID=A0A1V8T3F3_9PEZI|nr:hypothetical protein B0A48_10043 [Cryoendolithus antarcticus]
MAPPPAKKRKLSTSADDEHSTSASEQMTATTRFIDLVRSFVPELSESSPVFTRLAEQSLAPSFSSTDASLSAPPVSGSIDDTQAASTAAGIAHPLVRPDQATHDAIAQRARNIGGGVNLEQLVPGVGRYAWLTPYDREMARRMGVTDPSTITLTRSRRDAVFTSAHGPGTDPSVIWYSDRAFLNPPQQPSEPGHWEYQTPDAQEWAATQVGGSEDHGMPAWPSASDVWDLRQRLLTRGAFNITHDMALVFVPDEQPDDRSLADGEVEVDVGEVDRVFRYDPTNGDGPGGENGQTGDPDTFYHDWIRFEDGTTIVCDRVTAKNGNSQPHLFRAYGENGWGTYPRSSGFDWNNAASIKALKAWREQRLRRYSGLKRTEARPDYSARDLKWLGESKWSRVIDDFAKKGSVVASKRQTLKEQMDDEGKVVTAEEQRRIVKEEKREKEMAERKKREEKRVNKSKGSKVMPAYSMVIKKGGRGCPVTVGQKWGDDDKIDGGEDREDDAEEDAQ